jgi:hypothetical protein
LNRLPDTADRGLAAGELFDWLQVIERDHAREAVQGIDGIALTNGYLTMTVLSASMVTDFVTGEPFKGTILTS